MLTGLTALLVTAAMVALGIGTGTAQAANSAPSRAGAERHRAGMERYTVSPGESLWSVAENADPDADPRDIILEVIGLNKLTGTTIYPGEQLWVPRE